MKESQVQRFVSSGEDCEVLPWKEKTLCVPNCRMLRQERDITLELNISLVAWVWEQDLRQFFSV